MSINSNVILDFQDIMSCTDVKRFVCGLIFHLTLDVMRLTFGLIRVQLCSYFTHIKQIYYNFIVNFISLQVLQLEWE